jgi:hypothetical protein
MTVEQALNIEMLEVAAARLELSYQTVQSMIDWDESGRPQKGLYEQRAGIEAQLLNTRKLLAEAQTV